MQIQYTYDATTSDGKDKKGLIAAISVDEARQTLESMNLTVVDIEEVKIGRDNPFVPYSSSSVSQSNQTNNTTGTNANQTSTANTNSATSVKTATTTKK